MRVRAPPPLIRGDCGKRRAESPQIDHLQPRLLKQVAQRLGRYELRFSAHTADPASVIVLKHPNLRIAGGAEELVKRMYAVIGHVCQFNWSSDAIRVNEAGAVAGAAQQLASREGVSILEVARACTPAHIGPTAWETPTPGPPPG